MDGRGERIIRTSLIAVVLALSFSGCEVEKGSIPEVAEQTTPFAVDHDPFGYALFGALLDERLHEDSNVFISPTSIVFALAMAYNGSAEATEEAFRATMGWGAANMDEVNAAYSSLLDEWARFQNGEADVTLSIANSLWYNAGLSVNEDFTRRVRRAYKADIGFVRGEHFMSASTINAWVKRQTGGLIPRLVESLPADFVMMLVNTIYFRGDWTTPFDPFMTSEGTFRTATGERRSVSMMSRTGPVGYFEHGKIQAIRLPYGRDERFSMYVFLPNPDEGLRALVTALAEGRMDPWRQFEVKRGRIRIPRFTVEYKTSLKERLQQLGLAEAFYPLRANFHRMKPPEFQGPNLYIGDVVHQSILVVDEKGSEAAGATSITIQPTSLPVVDFEFSANRPFFVALRDDVAEQLLFIGAVTSP